MTEQAIKEAEIFSTRLPQTHHRAVADRVKAGKALRQRTPAPEMW
jgi:hypothetical protein